jgi:hypothetical protein
MVDMKADNGQFDEVSPADAEKSPQKTSGIKAPEKQPKTAQKVSVSNVRWKLCD